MLEVRSGDGIVFLDLEKDEYSCCYDPARPIGDYIALVEPVGSTGLDGSHPVLTSGWADARQWDLPRLGLGHIFRFIFALTRSGVQFHGRSVEELARTARHLGTGARRKSLTPHQVSNLFRYLMSLSPVKPKCLFSSFALLHFLDAYGLRADWVFGVRLFPFRAHCWLASDGVLLNELRHAIEDYAVIWTVDQGQR